MPSVAVVRFNRAVWAAWVVVALAVVATAAWLTPDPSGLGTHVQLGLPPCGFLVATGLPCPGCGLTTSFANMAHFAWADAFHANPFGVGLFLAMCASVPMAVRAGLRGDELLDTLFRTHADKIAIVLCVLAFGSWGIRLLGAVAH